VQLTLLLADLRAACNRLLHAPQEALTATLLPPVILGGMYWVIGRLILSHWELLPLLREGGDPVDYLFAHGLGPCPVVAGWIGFVLAQRQMFEAPELDLWLASPGWRGKAALQVMLRSGTTAMLWALALTVPLLWQLLDIRQSPPSAYALLPIAVAGAVLPSLLVVMTAQVALMRLARGRAGRAFLSVASALAAFGFPLFLLVQVFASTSGQLQAVSAVANGGGSPSVLVANAADLLSHAAEGALSAEAMWTVLGLLAAALVVFVLFAPLHPVAVQNHRLAHRPRRHRGRRWLGQAAATLRRKEVAQLLQQPGAVLHMLLVGGMVYLLAGKGVFVTELLQSPALPLTVRQVAAMLVMWAFSVLMLLYAHMGRLAIWDGAQWSLYSMSPTRPLTILQAKLLVIALLLQWPVLVAAVAGAHWFDAGPTAIAWLFAFTTAGTGIALATITAVGTWPWLVRREVDGRLSQGSKGMIGSLTLVSAFYFALAPAFLVWWDATHRSSFSVGGFDRHYSLSGLALQAAVYAAVLLTVALLLGRRNYRALMRAR
jgi:hypothetical protein